MSMGRIGGSIVKKSGILVLAAAVLLLFFTACESEPEPLRICMDLEYVNQDIDTDLEWILNDFLYSLKESGGIEDVEIEYLPKAGEDSDRESVLNRLRAEIMAGEGPDVFIVNCVGSLTGDYRLLGNSTSEALFPFPEKAMENGLFLPLDAYMENTQFTEWDKLTQSVLDAGRNEEGLQIVPLVYTFPMLCYRQSEGTYTPSAARTWNEVLTDTELSDEARMLGDCYLEFSDTYSAQAYLEFILGKRADFKEETLLFTEDELQQRLEEIQVLRDRTMGGESSENITDAMETYAGVNFLTGNTPIEWNLYPSDELTMVPLYSDDGGVTATIMSFAAVNRNTKRPEDAFTVIDILLSRYMQQRGWIYAELLYRYGYGVPMHEDLMQEEYPTTSSYNWYMNDANYEEFCKVRDQITSANFQDELSIAFWNLIFDYDLAVQKGENMEDFVSEKYREMERLIRE